MQFSIYLHPAYREYTTGSGGAEVNFKDIDEIVIETEDETPVLVATITEDEMIAAEGYRIRLKPKYD